MPLRSAAIPGPVSDSLSEIAKRHGVYVAFGLAERGPLVSGDVYRPYDAGLLVGPDGSIVIYSRKYQVLKNAFDPSECPPGTEEPGGGCSYFQADLNMIPVVDTILGKTALLVCADAYTWDTTTLDYVKAQGVETIIVVWGVAAGQESDCGTDGFDAVEYARQAAERSGAMVIGANAIGERPYGRFSGPSGQKAGFSSSTSQSPDPDVSRYRMVQCEYVRKSPAILDLIFLKRSHPFIL